MGKIKLFHGTTADALKDILQNGLLTNCDGANWNVSGENVYFWSPKYIQKHDKYENFEEISEVEDEAFRNAYDSASFGLAFAKDCRVVVLEIELEEDDLQEDDSCENMQGAVYSCNDIPTSAIKQIRISNDLSLLKGYFLTFHLNHKMIARTLSDMEKKIAKAFEDFDCDVDEILEWHDFSIDKPDFSS